MSCMIEALSDIIACNSQLPVIAMALIACVFVFMCLCFLRYERMLLLTKGGLRERYVVELVFEHGQTPRSSPTAAAYLGVDLTGELIVTQIQDGPVKTFNAKSALRVAIGDRVVMINGRPVASLVELQQVLAKCATAKLVLQRAGMQEEFWLPLATPSQSRGAVAVREGPDKNVAGWEKTRRKLEVQAAMPSLEAQYQLHPPKHHPAQCHRHGAALPLVDASRVGAAGAMASFPQMYMQPPNAVAVPMNGAAATMTSQPQMYVQAPSTVAVPMRPNEPPFAQPSTAPPPTQKPEKRIKNK